MEYRKLLLSKELTRYTYILLIFEILGLSSSLSPAPHSRVCGQSCIFSLLSTTIFFLPNLFSFLNFSG